MALKDIDERYELELEKIVDAMKSKNSRNVLIQLPDGLKQWGVDIVDYLKKEVDSDVEISLWLGDCFGACDLPLGNFDLVVQFGHAAWK
jgi:diphthamide biosynthesis enzyme Dph1/Dph2-like protein